MQGKLDLDTNNDLSENPTGLKQLEANRENNSNSNNIIDSSNFIQQGNNNKSQQKISSSSVLYGNKEKKIMVKITFCYSLREDDKNLQRFAEYQEFDLEINV